MSNETSTLTAHEIAAKINASGYDYYGDRARGWEGSNCSRIYFGSDFVTIEKDGRVHADRHGKARAQTIGYAAVEAVQSAISGNVQ